MYRVEMAFDTEDDEICNAVDKIFEKQNLVCADKSIMKRVYCDSGNKHDYGRFWAAFFQMKKDSDIVRHIKKCLWYNGADCENLMTEFLLA